jgi:DNA recombination protein RmuC
VEILVVVLLVALLGLVVWEARYRRHLESQIGGQRLEVSQALNAATQTLQGQINGLDQRLSGRLDTMQLAMSQTLSSTTGTIGEVKEHLGKLSSATTQVLELSKDISSLQDILRPPKLRGGLGELLLANLLGQVLPPSNYQLQFTFASGETVDAVIRLRDDLLIPVDSKFPLDSFSRFISSSSEEERRACRRSFVRDVKGHLDSVAKYIRPDEGTSSFAMMYIPAENVYYEVLLKEDLAGGEGIVDYALEKRVIPVSPSSFYAYLQAIVLGLKGMRVEESAREIVAHLERLGHDFERLQEEFSVLGTHIGHARSKYDDLERTISRFGERLSRPLTGEAYGRLPNPPAEGP